MQKCTGKSSWFEQIFKQAERWCEGIWAAIFLVKTAELTHLVKQKQFIRGQALKVGMPALEWSRGSSTHTCPGFGLVPSLSLNTHGLGTASVAGRDETWWPSGWWNTQPSPSAAQGSGSFSAHTEGIVWALSRTCCGPIQP